MLSQIDVDGRSAADATGSGGEAIDGFGTGRMAGASCVIGLAIGITGAGRAWSNDGAPVGGCEICATFGAGASTARATGMGASAAGATIIGATAIAAAGESMGASE